MKRYLAPTPIEAQGMGMTSQRARDRLVERLRQQGIRSGAVLEVIGKVPRHLFVDEALASRAYEDTALPIGHGQTISQPYVVALMTQALLDGGPRGRVLEIGSGSGYQAAVLSPLVTEVYSVERIEDLLRQARKRWRQLGYKNIRSKHDDGNIGWREHAPFDAVIVTAARDGVDPALLEQVAPGGVLLAPIGPPGMQELLRLTRGEDQWKKENLGAVSFVPLVKGVL